ncbi:ribosomal protein L18a, partial [Tanacetum coccineum]
MRLSRIVMTSNKDFMTNRCLVLAVELDGSRFAFPVMWYYATFLYFGNYYRKDPRERAGLAASAIANALAGFCNGMFGYLVHCSNDPTILAYVVLIYASLSENKSLDARKLGKVALTLRDQVMQLQFFRYSVLKALFGFPGVLFE